MSESEDSAENQTQSLEQEVDAMLERKFQHVQHEHPAMQVLMREARRHWLEALRTRDDD